MTKETVFANARLILPDEVICGHLVICDGRIEEIGQGVDVPSGAIDVEGDYICPGLIELHTDNLERHMRPRPRVDWPHKAAIIAHDRELAGTGITTVFDAIRVGSIITTLASRYARYARGMADEILAMQASGALKIDHRLHLRAEICSETLAEELDEFGATDEVGILSLMDHTPGQRQFRDARTFEDFVITKHGLSREGFTEYIDFLYGLQDRFGALHEAAAVAAAKRLGATLASHDDTTSDQVCHSHANGVVMAEFPTTMEAAETCHGLGMSTIMGAPNLIRGGSHSGNVAAHQLAERQRLDVLSSDYIPASLLLGAVKLGDIWGDMSAGIRTVTRNPAARVGLTDRGQLAPGLRADLVRFRIAEGCPAVVAVWSQGSRVA